MIPNKSQSQELNKVVAVVVMNRCCELTVTLVWNTKKLVTIILHDKTIWLTIKKISSYLSSPGGV